MKNLLMFLCCSAFVGCVSMTRGVEKPFVDPEFGMTKAQLIQTEGAPESIEAYRRNDQTRIEFYVYVKRYSSSQIKVPVCLIDNRVAGWGETFYTDHRRMDDVRIK